MFNKFSSAKLNFEGNKGTKVKSRYLKNKRKRFSVTQLFPL